MCDNIILERGDVIKCLQENENYEFMGIPQRVKMDNIEIENNLLKIVKQRSHIIWSSQLSDANKCTASNIFINSCVEYYFWAVKFPVKAVREMDSAIRDSMNVTGSKHTNQMNAINYIPRIKGGRGLRSLEDSYKNTKIKLALKLVNDPDPRMEIVKAFHEKCMQTNSFSIFKDAERYAAEIGIKITNLEEKLVFVDSDENKVITEKSISNTLKTKRYRKYYSEIISSTWQGINFRQRIDDENLVKAYFSWMHSWKTCPTEVINEFYLLFYQLLATKQYKSIRSNEIIEDMSCRICHIGQQESVKHLISNCSVLANGLYKRRHDDALKCFIWSVLYKFNIIEKQPIWYAPDKVKPYYENETFKFWWDCPEYTGYDNEVPHPLRPDGKIMVNDGNEKKIFLIEMTVPWIENREEKYLYKCAKYNNILQNLKFEYPDYEVDQITIVMDVFGGYGTDLSKNLGKIIKERETVQSIITNMQKSVISSAANLSRTFKIRTKY